MDGRLPVLFLPLDGTICHIRLVFYEIRQRLQFFLAKIKGKEMPQNAPSKVFKKVHKFLVKIQMKLGHGNKKVLKPSIGQKSSLRFHPLIEQCI